MVVFSAGLFWKITVSYLERQLLLFFRRGVFLFKEIFLIEKDSVILKAFTSYIPLSISVFQFKSKIEEHTNPFGFEFPNELLDDHNNNYPLE